ncbi:MAG: hypothetical protein HFF08_02170 [Oscillospiraceae bacterium]|nr:hypothetical protein [Oscillospiraceae bacterium]
MLSDIPYKNLLDKGRKYDVWMLRDVYNNTFADIAREYRVSVSTIVSDYEKILFLKTKYYINHLSIVQGYENTAHFRKIWWSAFDCYCGIKYVVTYFEKEYADILKEYRNGEPGMPDEMIQALPPLRSKFNKRVISNIIYLRETEGLTYAAIGKRLRVTKEKANNLYNHYYHDLYFQLSERIMNITGDMDLRDKYQKAFHVGNGKKQYDCLVEDYPELCENFLKGEKEK